jgi:uncharacterized protein (TIGR03083 family)
VPVVDAFRAESARLAGVMLALDEPDFDLPTRCAPWTVAELLAHVRTATDRLTTMLAEPAPPAPQVDAAGYYRPALFEPALDAARVAAAQQEAGQLSGHALAAEFDRTWRAVVELVVGQAPDRVVRTRYGDAMLLADFLVTRVVEVGVHGLDLADALRRPPWLTEPAAVVIEGVLVAVGDGTVAGRLGWDRLTFIRKATGRARLTDAEHAEIDRHGVRWLTLG